MALIPCPACGNQISTLAVSCPQCGDPITDSIGPSAAEEPREGDKVAPKGSFLRTIFYCVVVFFGVTWFLSEDTEDFLGFVDFYLRKVIDSPVEVSKQYDVTASKLNQRDCASPGCPVVGQLNKGDTVLAYEVRGRWVRVTPETSIDKVKWVAAQYLTENKSASRQRANARNPVPQPTAPAPSRSTSARATSSASGGSAALTYQVDTPCVREQKALADQQKTKNTRQNKATVAYCRTTDNKLFLINLDTYYQITFCEDARSVAESLNVARSRIGLLNSDRLDCGSANYFKPGDPVFGVVYRSDKGSAYNSSQINTKPFKQNANTLFARQLSSNFNPSTDYDPPLVKSALP